MTRADKLAMVSIFCMLVSIGASIWGYCSLPKGSLHFSTPLMGAIANISYCPPNTRIIYPRIITMVDWREGSLVVEYGYQCYDDEKSDYYHRTIGTYNYFKDQK